MTDDQIEDIFDATPFHPDKYLTFARAIINADRAQRQAGQAFIDLPCEMPDWSDVSRRTAYRLGHKAACRAAAELAAPQPAHVPLTDEQIRALWVPHYSDPLTDYTEFARFIEQAHGITTK